MSLLDSCMLKHALPNNLTPAFLLKDAPAAARPGRQHARPCRQLLRSRNMSSPQMRHLAAIFNLHQGLQLSTLARLPKSPRATQLPLTCSTSGCVCPNAENLSRRRREALQMFRCGLRDQGGEPPVVQAFPCKVYPKKGATFGAGPAIRVFRQLLMPKLTLTIVDVSIHTLLPCSSDQWRLIRN